MGNRSILMKVKDLHNDMVLAENIYDGAGNELLMKHTVISQKIIDKLNTFGFYEVMIVAEVDEAKEEEMVDFKSAQSDIIKEETRTDAQSAIKEALSAIGDEKSVNMQKINVVVQRILNEILNSDSVIVNLGKMKDLNDYLFYHSINVCVLSLIIGIHMGFNKQRLMELGVGAMMHDIGKMMLPSDILAKPTRLTEEEFEVVKEHSQIGYKLLQGMPNVSEASCQVALHHHERFDGKGYPNGEINDTTHVYSKIVGLCDVFDAMTSDKIYGKKISPFNAMEYIINSIDSRFDANVVKVLLKVVGYYPVGVRTFVNNGEYGVVVKKDRFRPTIKILVDSRLNRVKDYYEIDLEKNPSIFITDVDLKKTFYKTS